MSDQDTTARAAPHDLAAHVRAIRLGHGANCSSIGSVIDTLFVGALLGGAIFAAVAAALASEPVKVVGSGGTDRDEDARRPTAGEGS